MPPWVQLFCIVLLQLLPNFLNWAFQNCCRQATNQTLQKISLTIKIPVPNWSIVSPLSTFPLNFISSIGAMTHKRNDSSQLIGFRKLISIYRKLLFYSINMKNMNMIFIYLFFMKTSEKIKHLVGYRFQELFPNPKNGLGLGTPCCHTPRVCFWSSTWIWW